MQGGADVKLGLALAAENHLDILLGGQADGREMAWHGLDRLGPLYEIGHPAADS